MQVIYCKHCEDLLHTSSCRARSPQRSFCRPRQSPILWPWQLPPIHHLSTWCADLNLQDCCHCRAKMQACEDLSVHVYNLLSESVEHVFSTGHKTTIKGMVQLMGVDFRSLKLTAGLCHHPHLNTLATFSTDCSLKVWGTTLK
jgi:hypothetical protein